MSLIIVRREMPGRAVVPDRHRPRFPRHAADIVGLRCGVVQTLQQRQAFLPCPAHDIDREGAVYIQQFAPGLRVADYDGMGRTRLQPLTAQIAADVGLRV